MIYYKLRCDILSDENSDIYETYGIDIFDGVCLICSVSDISTDKSTVSKLVPLLNKAQPSLIHFRDVIEDFTNSN